jgi:sulfonate transport system substrate-binding protein
VNSAGRHVRFTNRGGVSSALACALGVGFFAFALAGCGHSDSAHLSSKLAANQPALLRIGYQKSNALLNLLRVRKVLENRFGSRVNVVWQEFPAGPQLLEGLNVGSIDFGCTGEVPPIFAQAAEAPLLYVVSEGAGPATEAILVRRDSPYQSLAELKGKRIALNKASNVHYLLLRALENSGLSIGEIEPVYLTPADARAAFESSRVEAWAIWDPYYSEASDSGQARMLIDGTGLVENRGYYLATRQFATEQPETLSALVTELRTLSDWAAGHRDEFADFLANQLEMAPRVLRVAERRRKFGVQTMGPELVAYQQQIADAFFRAGLIPHEIRVNEAIWNADRR